MSMFSGVSTTVESLCETTTEFAKAFVPAAKSLGNVSQTLEFKSRGLALDARAEYVEKIHATKLTEESIQKAKELEAKLLIW